MASIAARPLARSCSSSPQAIRILSSPASASQFSPIFSTQPAFLSNRFSTSSNTQARDRNRVRGQSALHRKGPKHPLSVSHLPLPQPVDKRDPTAATKPVTDDNHPLWGFFYPEKSRLISPEEHAKHGRAWTVEECRQKSWEDLHALWWQCCLERNRIATHEGERKRLKAGYGQQEAEERDAIVKKTQKAIRHALTERWYAWQDARKLAREDPEVDLTGEASAYDPQALEEETFMKEESGKEATSKDAPK